MQLPSLGSACRVPTEVWVLRFAVLPSQRIHQRVWEMLSLETSVLKLLGKQTLTNKREVCSEFV